MTDTAKMSDPAKSPAEIEDVLSSIRRLVSEHHPAPETPRPDASQNPDDTAPEDAAADNRLVLTPALRVTDPDDPWTPVSLSPPAQAEDASDAPEGIELAEPGFAPDDRLSDWGEVEAEMASTEEDGTGDDIRDAGEVVADLLREPDAGDAVATEIRLEVGDGAEDPGEIADLEALDGLLSADGDGFEPETGDEDWPDMGADGAARQLAAARGADLSDPQDDADSAEPEAPMTEPEPTATASDSDSDSDEAQLPDAPSVTETEEADGGAPFTPVFSRGNRQASRAETGAADAARPEGTTAVPEADPADHGIEDLGEAASPFSFPDTDEGILDEDTLREIIVDVVREELQGVLGQRITRNVRKMVRREIRLALAAEELE